MKQADIEKIAIDILAAKDQRNTLPPPTSIYADFGLKESYQVLVRLNQMLEARGYRPLGRKIGLTNKVTWQLFKSNTPMWGYVYDKTLQPASSGQAVVSIADTVAPRIETEVVLKIRQDIEAIPKDAYEMIQSVQSIAIGFEIVDCHYPGWKLIAPDAVADLGLHAGLVMGPELVVTESNRAGLVEQIKDFDLELCLDGGVVATGKGENSLGSPLLALKHLVEVVSEQPWAWPIATGEVVTTGTLTPLPEIKSGQTWSVRLAGIDLAALEIEIE